MTTFAALGQCNTSFNFSFQQVMRGTIRIVCELLLTAVLLNQHSNQTGDNYDPCTFNPRSLIKKSDPNKSENITTCILQQMDR